MRGPSRHANQLRRVSDLNGAAMMTAWPRRSASRCSSEVHHAASRLHPDLPDHHSLAVAARGQLQPERALPRMVADSLCARDGVTYVYGVVTGEIEDD